MLHQRKYTMAEHKGMKRAVHFISLFCLMLSLCVCNDAAAQFSLKQPETVAVPEQELTVETVQELVEKIRVRIEEAQQDSKRATTDGSANEQSELHERILRLKLVKNTYALILNALTKKAKLARDAESLQHLNDETLSKQLPQKPPYALNIYDDLLRQAFEARQTIETTDIGIRQTKKSIDSIVSEIDRDESGLRLLKERIVQPLDEEKRLQTQQEIARTEIELELGRAHIALQKISLENLQYEQSNADMTLQSAHRLLDRVRGNVIFEKKDLETITEAIDKQQQALQEKIQYILRKQNKVRDARAREDARTGEAGRGDAVDPDPWDETWSRSLEFTETMVTLLNRKQQVWQWRFDLINNDVPYKTVQSWRESAERMRSFLDFYLDNQQTFHANLLERISANEMALEQNPEPQLKEELHNQLRALETLRTYSMDYLTALTAGKPLLRRLFDDLSAEVLKSGPGINTEVLVARLEAFWNFELWSIDDKTVTVKKVLNALLLLFFGVIAAKYFIGFAVRGLLQRTRLQSGAVAAINKILFYCAILLVALLSFRLVNIPLTVFTFLGGAVAIGIGFGAQNLINNFISGLVIMAERPIKVDDMIEVEGHFARVEEIGARCTRIRTGENVHILVPNSSFLEKNIVNWTLSDKVVRAKVSVGVIYGSPVRDVQRLMLQAAAEQPKIHKIPQPFVLFDDFGDNALVFEIHFWLTMQGMMEIRRVSSDIRFRIEDLFREAGLVIAFPQRDVHLDTLRPIEVLITNTPAKPLV